MNKKEKNSFLKFINEIKDFNSLIKKYSRDEYWNTIRKIEDFLQLDYYNKNIIIKDVVLGNFSYDLTLGQLLSYLILLNPFNAYKKEFKDEFFIDITNPSNLDDYFNLIIQYFSIENEIDISENIKEISDELTMFASKNYLKASGVSISLYDMIQLSKENPTIKKCMNFKSTSKMVDPQKLAKKQDENLEKFINEIEKTDNNFSKYLKSDSGINVNQFGEVFCFIGYKPDYFGNIIPKPINSSFVRGLSVTEFFVNATGARKALTTSKGQVKSSGYLNRKLGLLMSDCRIKNPMSNYDCGTKHTIPIFIDNQKTLNRFNNRYRVNEKGKVVVIDSNDEKLIGTTINLRSPITCACKNDEVCPICYGRLSRINKTKNIGTISNLILTNPLTQKLLSSKHLLKANIKKMEWSEDFLNLFYINENKIYYKEDLVLLIEKDNLLENEESDINKYSVTDFKVKFNNEIYDLHSDVPLYLNSELYDIINDFFNEESEYYVIPTKKIQNIDELFYLIIENQGIADPLLEIKDLMEKNSFIKSHTIEETFERFIYLLNKSKVDIDSVHIELILREMLFIIENGNDKTIFKESKTFPKYALMNITEGIQLGSLSPSKSLMFEQIQKQIMTDSYNNVFGKDGKSSLDIFFED